jgi:hypothetical protein
MQGEITLDSRIFTTEKIAELLGLPEWRVVRFGQIKKFSITPAYGQADGSGSRRLYDIENVCEIALASWLLETGMQNHMVGRVIKRIQATGGMKRFLTMSDLEARKKYLGVLRVPPGKKKITDVEAVFVENWDHIEQIFERRVTSTLLIIALGRRLKALASSLQDEP